MHAPNSWCFSRVLWKIASKFEVSDWLLFSGTTSLPRAPRPFERCLLESTTYEIHVFTLKFHPQSWYRRIRALNTISNLINQRRRLTGIILLTFRFLILNIRKSSSVVILNLFQKRLTIADIDATIDKAECDVRQDHRSSWNRFLG